MVAPAASVTTHHRRDIVEQLLVNDRRVLTLERLRLMLDPTNVGLVGQHCVQRRFIKRLAASRLSRFRFPRLQAPSTTVKFFDHRRHRLHLEVQAKNTPHLRRLVRVDHQLRAWPGSVDVVAQHRNTARPFPSPSLSRNLVANPLADDLSLELCERKQNIQRQPTHRVRRIELLRHRNERHAMVVERFHDLREVQQATTQSVDLIHDHAINLSRRDIFQQSFHRGPVNVAARVAAIVVPRRNDLPALLRLTGDEVLAGFTLGVQRIEFLIETFLSRLTSVNRAPNNPPFRFRLLFHFCLLPSRKKRNPL